MHKCSVILWERWLVMRQIHTQLCFQVQSMYTKRRMWKTRTFLVLHCGCLSKEPDLLWLKFTISSWAIFLQNCELQDNIICILFKWCESREDKNMYLNISRVFNQGTFLPPSRSAWRKPMEIYILKESLYRKYF